MADCKEEIYNQYYDCIGNYHFTGTKTGKHIIRLENAVVPNELFLNREEQEDA